MFDFIVFAVIVVGLALLISSIVGYDSYIDKLDGYYEEYEEKYDIDTDISQEDYEALPDADKQRYDDAMKAFNEDQEILKTYSIMMSLTMVIISLSILFAYVITEFIVPICLKNGQTLGKRIFGIALMRTDGVKITTFQLFVRTILGKYTIETMVPVLLVIMMFFGTMGLTAPIVIILLALLQAIVIIVTKTNSAIHDLLAVTVAVDMSSQLIFDSEEKMIEEVKKLETEYMNLSGKQMKFFRPPMGEYSEKTLDVTKKLGYTNVFWSFAYKDWEVNNQKGTGYAYNQIMDGVHDGAVLLLHAVSKDNAEILDKVITDLKAQGYTFKSLENFNK